MITLDRLKKAKAVYNSIEIPEQLNAIVTKTIANTKEEKSHKARYGKYILSTVGGVFLTFVLMLNISPSFATTFSDIPIIGNVAKVFTIREYTKKDDEKLIDAKIPALENTGNTDLEKRVNYEIMLKMNEVQEEAEERAAQYKNAVIETGGTEEDYQPITIQIDYKVGYSSDKVVSFVILKSETLASAYTERFFYNIDIESGKELNLRDVLGNDYKQIVDETIYKEIEERSKNPNNSYFTKDEGGFSGIENEYQNFYINSD